MKLFITVFVSTLLLAACTVGAGIVYLRAHDQLEQQTAAPGVQDLICLHYVAVDRPMLAGECREL